MHSQCDDDIGFTARLLTVNTHKGFTSFNRRFMLHDLREALRHASPDIVFLQEVVGAHAGHADRFPDWPALSQYEYLADTLRPIMPTGAMPSTPKDTTAMRFCRDTPSPPTPTMMSASKDPSLEVCCTACCARLNCPVRCMPSVFTSDCESNIGSVNCKCCVSWPGATFPQRSLCSSQAISTIGAAVQTGSCRNATHVRSSPRTTAGQHDPILPFVPFCRWTGSTSGACAPRDLNRRPHAFGPGYPIMFH